MKKSLLLLLAVALGIISCKTHFKTTQKDYSISDIKFDLDHGKNMTYNVCGPCHYDYMSTKSFTGKRMKDLPKFMGKIYSANLTSYKGGIMDQYSDAELFYLLKTGIARDGRYIPYMVRPTMADDDIYSVIKYLRSGDQPVAANPKSAGTTKTSFLGKIATSVSGKPQPLMRGVVAPASSDKVGTGRYLVDIFACYHCHSKSILGLNYTEPEKSKGYMAGGMKYNVDGKKIFASNLTMDPLTGIADYSEAEFLRAVREGIDNHDDKLSFPMPHFVKMTDEQGAAIFAYLKTIPAKKNKVKGH